MCHGIGYHHLGKTIRRATTQSSGGRKLTDFKLKRSRATSPLFYAAPHPEAVTPYAYQLAGVEYALACDHHLNGDAPGLGKTAEAIMLGNAIEAKNTLVVCPASLRLNWQREIQRWSTLFDVTTYPVLKSKDGIHPTANYVIISYALLNNPAILLGIMDRLWDHLILDEAHALKDPKGNTRTKVVCAPDLLPSVCGRITMLSGTIMPNQPVEVYNACRLLDWDSIDQMSLNSFRKHYYAMGSGFVTIRGKPQWSNNVRNVPVNLEELQQRLRGNFMVRRLKEQVLTQLPPKTWSLFPIQMTGAIKKALSHPGWKVAEKLYELDDNALDSGIPIDGEIATARRELGEAKVPAIIEYIQEKLDEVDKLVVCAWHHSVLDTLKEALAGYGLVYMDGTTSARNRQAAVDQFQDDGRVRIILGQMQTLGEGWTLTAAQDVVVAEPDWVPGKNDQMLDRIHRIGAEDADYVIGHVPVVPGSLDERILAVAIAKDKNIYEALDA